MYTVKYGEKFNNCSFRRGGIPLLKEHNLLHKTGGADYERKKTKKY